MSDNKAVDLYYENFGTKVGIGLSEPTITKIANANSTLFAPITAWLQGKAAQITVGFLPFYDKLAERKNQNLQNLALNVIRELKNREDEGKPIPDKFEDTDNLLFIQDKASTTSEKEISEMWAKLYTEEACKNGSVSRKTIILIESLNANTAKIIEEEVFPFCDENGFYWGSGNRIEAIKKAQEYGIIQNISLNTFANNINLVLTKKINEQIALYLYPNYIYKPNNDFMLTTSGLEIRNILKIYPKKENYSEIFAELTKSSNSWNVAEPYKDKIKMHTQITNEQKFILCNEKEEVIYPTNQIYKTLNEFYHNAMSNIEVVDNNK